MTTSWPESLRWQHYVTAQAVHASVGLISDHLLALAIEIGADAVVFHAVVKERSEKVLDDLDYMSFELDALLALPRVAVSFDATVGTSEPWPRAGTIPIYRVHDDRVDSSSPPAQ